MHPPQRISADHQFIEALLRPDRVEEYLGYGLSMAMTVHARDGALAFRSDSYFLRLFGRSFKLPGWLSPGLMTVTHSELGNGRFIFTLEVAHPTLGVLIRQSAAFQEAKP